MSEPQVLYFEDFPVGWRYRTTGATLTESQILDFAWTWDPQPFHIDLEAAKDWGYGGLIASGWQTVLVGFRLFLQANVINGCSIGSPGLDELRWLRPVRPGDTVHTRIEVLEARPSGSKPDRGFAKMRYDILNQEDEIVATMTATQILRRRPGSY